MVRSFVFKNDKSLLMGFVPQNVWIKPCWEYGHKVCGIMLLRSRLEVFCKKVFPKFRKIHKKTTVHDESFFIISCRRQLATLLKRGSGAVLFL